MERLLNLVGTRVPAGDHDAALAWYADHVHQLFGFPGLHEAWLYRRTDVPGAAAAAHADVAAGPELICLYDFGTLESFRAYEASALYQAVQRDRMAGWGRDGIEITTRRQYHRLYRVQRAAVDGTACRIAGWRGGMSATAERALAARFFDVGAAACTLLRRATDAAAPSAAGAAPDADHVALIDGAGAPIPAVPGLEPLWQSPYERLMHWVR